MYNHIVDFMEDNDIISKYQFGFRRKHSTQHAVICIVNNIFNSLDSNNIVISIFLDLKKSFDTVDHKILLKKLYAYGIRGTTHRWFHSYLSDRPQGSILGPLLFIIYVNDICNVSDLLFKMLYADDTSVLIHGKHIDELINNLNIELEYLNVWLQANKLSLNARFIFDPCVCYKIKSLE